MFVSRFVFFAHGNSGISSSDLYVIHVQPSLI